MPAGEGSGLFYPPFEASATGGDTVAMAVQALYVSRNNGDDVDAAGLSRRRGAAHARWSCPTPTPCSSGSPTARVLRTTWSGAALGRR